MISDARHLITSDLADQLIRKFPESESLLSHLVGTPLSLQNGRGCCMRANFDRLWNPAPSMLCEFTDLALDLMAVSGDFSDAVKDVMTYQEYRGAEVAERLALNILPWDIPTNSELDKLEAAVGPFQAYGANPAPDESKTYYAVLLERQLKFFFSPAAASTRFLKSLPRETRTQIRSIILNENYRAVAEPECHAKALVPFFRENRRLRIERRVDLWRALCSEICPQQYRDPRYRSFDQL